MAEAGQAPPPTPAQDPGGGEYVTPTRPLKLAELARIHRELDYIQRFTNRYKMLFDSHFFPGNEDLMHMYETVCNTLVAMQALGPTIQANCTAVQKQMITVEQVKQYIMAVAAFSEKSLRALMHDHAHAANFPHWEHDHAVLILMRNGLTTLIDEITPDGANGATPPPPQA
jgi:hypothetical protein